MDNSDEDEFPLSADQMEKLAQLQDLTRIEDTAVCRALLESNNWDLEGTVREQLGIQQPNNEDDREPPRQPAPPRVAPPPLHQPAVWRRPGGLVGLLLYVASLPIRIVTASLGGVWSFVSSLLGFPPRRADRVRDPIGDVRAFVDDFEAKFGRTHPPVFLASYLQVLEEAKRELKFLLVYLHSEDHQDTERFCATTLSDPQVVDYVTQQMLFWGCSVSRPEGYRVSEALRESSYPFLAVIVLRQNRMVVVGRQEGYIAGPDLLAWLEKVIREFEAFIVAARVDRDERNFNREIRSEQEAAFAETLRQDQERENQRLEEERREQDRRQQELKEEEEEKRRLAEEEERKERLRQLKIDLLDEIPEEPDSGCREAIRILIKLPGGQRLERRFLPTHSLKHIYYFVFCHPDSPDEFDIVTNYPKRTLACRPSPELPEPPSLQEAGFNQSEMLFVNDLDA